MVMDQKNFAAAGLALVKLNRRWLGAVADVSRHTRPLRASCVEPFHRADVALQIMVFNWCAGANRPLVLKVLAARASISACPSFTPASIAASVAGSTFEASHGLPGPMPIFSKRLRNRDLR